MIPTDSTVGHIQIYIYIKLDHVHFYNNMRTYTTISPYLFKDYPLLFNQTQFIASYLMLPVFSQISSIKRLVGCRVREL